jgi:hypothetical protein
MEKDINTIIDDIEKDVDYNEKALRNLMELKARVSALQDKLAEYEKMWIE